MAEIVHLHCRRDEFRIVIARGLWRGFEVTIDPPTSNHPLRHFKTYDEAMACALQIQRVEGWPLFALMDEDPEGGRDAAN